MSDEQEESSPVTQKLSAEEREKLKAARRKELPTADLPAALLEHPDRLDGEMLRRLRQIMRMVAECNAIVQKAPAEHYPDFYRRRAQDHLVRVFEQTRLLLYSVGDNSQPESIPSTVLRLIRKGELKEGFSLKVKPPPTV